MDPAGAIARGLRRYSSNHRVAGSAWNCSGGYHSAVAWVDTVPMETHLDRDGTRVRDEVPQFERTDSRWPALCHFCQYRFTDEDPRQTFTVDVYRREDTGQEYGLPGIQGPYPDFAPEAPAGAMWHAWWLPHAWRGEDGIALCVLLPNHRVWIVDSRASNCDQPEREHKCWVRHGDPREGHVTVDKQGDTCSAGAGSIAADDYHGFLVNGLLTAG